MTDSSPKILTLKVDPSAVDLRLDVFLSKHPDIGTRSRAAKLIHQSYVTSARAKAIKPSLKLELDDTITVRMPEASITELTPFDMDLDVVFEDSHLLVVNKPAGLVVHPSAGHEDKTLVNALVHHCKDLSMGFSEHRPGIVHRLDKDTSGLLVVAKSDAIQLDLAKQFKERTAKRTYWAMVFGPLKVSSGHIESHLKRHPSDRKKFASERLSEGDSPTGRWAATNYETIGQHASGISWLSVKLETGRTHQIRVHLTELGHPILGDQLYGSIGRAKNLKSVKIRTMIKNLNRIGLHAHELGVVHPVTGEDLSFQAPWPVDLTALVQELGFE